MARNLTVACIEDKAVVSSNKYILERNYLIFTELKRVTCTPYPLRNLYILYISKGDLLSQADIFQSSCSNTQGVKVAKFLVLQIDNLRNNVNNFFNCIVYYFSSKLSSWKSYVPLSTNAVCLHWQVRKWNPFGEVSPEIILNVEVSAVYVECRYIPV